MARSIITKIRGGKITLPKGLQKEWAQGEVVFMRSPGGFTVKSITPPSLTTLSGRLSEAAKKAKLTPKDVKDAVAWARKKTYAGRA
ncbi:MAG: hypothetical protein AAB410_02315 [Patescibacteria group bacterium]